MQYAIYKTITASATRLFTNVCQTAAASWAAPATAIGITEDSREVATTREMYENIINNNERECEMIEAQIDDLYARMDFLDDQSDQAEIDLYGCLSTIGEV
jgi:hypothetical protein